MVLYIEALTSSLSGHSLYIATGFLLLTCVLLLRDEQPYQGFKLVGKEPGEWLNTKAKDRFSRDAVTILKQGFKETNGRPFQVISTQGPLIVLPPAFCDEIRNDDRLSFTGFIERQSLTTYPGLDTFHVGTQGDIIQETVRKHLTQALGALTESLSSECSTILDQQLPSSVSGWTEANFLLVATNVAAGLSAKVFLGEPLCRDRDWLDISIQFTVVSMRAQEKLRWWPPFLRPFVHRFIPELIYMRSQIKKARKIIEPEVAARRRRREEQAEKTKPMDTISWLDDVRKGRSFDVVSGQLFLTVAAIHTTSTVLAAVLYDLIAHPTYIGLLREEIIKVFTEDGGWKKTTLYKMKLMDSCMKESQCLHILGPNMMNRRVEADIPLSDGTLLRKGVHVCVPTYQMRDKDIWGQNADDFVGERFLKMREEPGQENRWQFVTTSSDFLSFGHGKHACPGRFFASNEIKTALVHLLMKFEWEFVGALPENLNARKRTGANKHWIVVNGR